MNKNGFTFIEILVVVTIISLLAATGAISYTQFLKQSRDAKRKTDIEQIRAAVEMYKSNNGIYPLSINLSTCSPGAITDANTTYLSKIPNDPKCSTYVYYYSSTDGSTYTIAAFLENSSSPVCGGLGANSCNAFSGCNYCVGPYGQL